MIIAIDPVVRDFILYCAQRQGSPTWPGIYDEMCRVAGQRLYQGLGYAELRSRGLSFSLSNIEDTIRKVDAVTTGN